MEVAPLVYPSATDCQFPEPGQSVGNERSNLFSDRVRHGIECRTPHLKTFPPFDEYRIEEVHPVRMGRLHRHEIQHPFPALEGEVHTVNDECEWPARKARRRRRDERTENMLEPPCDAASPESAEVSCFFGKRVTVKKDA